MDSSQVIHVYPMDEEERHSLVLSVPCGCYPAIEGQEDCILVIHNELGPLLIA